MRPADVKKLAVAYTVLAQYPQQSIDE